jgi:hypothetical protein
VSEALALELESVAKQIEARVPASVKPLIFDSLDRLLDIAEGARRAENARHTAWFATWRSSWLKRFLHKDLAK